MVRALAKTPEDRFADADELLEALLAAIDEDCDDDVVVTAHAFAMAGPTLTWATAAAL